MFTDFESEKKDKVQVPQWSEMLSFYCTALGFSNKNEEYNPEKNILMVGIWKTWYHKKLLSSRKWSA